MGVRSWTPHQEITFSSTPFVLLTLLRKEKRMRDAVSGVMEILRAIILESISCRVWPWAFQDALGALVPLAGDIL